MSAQYTRREAARIVGVEQSQLDYWARLRLVTPRARWGERFFTFNDLVALHTIKHLIRNRIPAQRLRRAILALARQLGQTAAPLSMLRVMADGRGIVVIPPTLAHPPIEPLTGQFLLNFEVRELEKKVRALCGRSAEEWFEIGLASDSSPETLPQAVDAYRHAVVLAPDWVEAHINLGTALFQFSRLRDSERSFRTALALAPEHPAAHFNLGCVLDELGKLDEAIRHLRRAVELAPDHADAHFNLALTYAKRGKERLSRREWSAYLRLEPRGPWADYARSHAGWSSSRSSRKPIPFRRDRPST